MVALLSVTASTLLCRNSTLLTLSFVYDIQLFTSFVDGLFERMNTWGEYVGTYGCLETVT